MNEQMIFFIAGTEVKGSGYWQSKWDLKSSRAAIQDRFTSSERFDEYRQHFKICLKYTQLCY